MLLISIRINFDMVKQYWPCQLCGRESSFRLEWDGLNQHGTNPYELQTLYCCSDISHLSELANNMDYGFSDNIYLIAHSREKKCDKVKNLLAEIECHGDLERMEQT